MGLSPPISSSRQSIDSDMSPQQWWKSIDLPVYILLSQFYAEAHRKRSIGGRAREGEKEVGKGQGNSLHGEYGCKLAFLYPLLDFNKKLFNLYSQAPICIINMIIFQLAHPYPSFMLLYYPLYLFVRFRYQFLQIIIFSISFSDMRTSSESILIKRKPRAVSSFLKKTYELLNDHINEETIKWAPSGIGFIVVNQEVFSKEVLPKYFKHSNYSSFVRQLNMYNFHKIRENNSESYFHHQSFDKFNQQKLADIKRKPQKKKRKNEESEDDLPSDHEQNQSVRPTIINKKVKEQVKVARPPFREVSLHKIQQQKNTRHFVSEQCHEQHQENCSLRNIAEYMDDDKLSINNDISERVIPRLATRELINPSNSNLFPFGAGKGQTSNFCLFY